MATAWCCWWALLLLQLGSSAVVLAFVPPLGVVLLSSSSTTRTGSPRTILFMSKSHYDDEIARLQHEFKMLQETLLQKLVLQHDSVSAEQMAEQMLDLAADAVALQRYKKLEHIDQAQHHLEQAREDRLHAAALKEQAHEAEQSAEREAALVESMDAAYEDLERLRELSKAHAAHHVEEDARELELESTFQELEAEAQQEEARQAIAELRDYEQRLRESVHQIRQLQCETAMKEWQEKEQHKYDSVLDQIKWKFNL